jgi:class 3 adenylate cyclase
VSKSIRLLSDQNRSLLHTFIPAGVAARLAAHPPGEMLEAAMEDVILMFCSVAPRPADPDTFALLHRVFSDFDAAVAAAGMFKYQVRRRAPPSLSRAPPPLTARVAPPQHVGDWYIVACPRAAAPFDPAEQALPPGAHAPAMLRLAAALRRAAARHDRAGARGGGAGAPLGLRVGIAMGPAAGVVIGGHRRFYCLYGDTVNMAARLCATAAPPHAAHTEARFAAAVGRAGLGWARCRTRGLTAIKGKGLVETFDIHAAPHRPRPASPPRSARQAGGGEVEAAGGGAVGSGAAEGGAGGGSEAAAAAAWLGGPRQRIGRAWATFADAGVEQAFLRAAAPAAGRRLRAGLGLHGLAVAAQWMHCAASGGGGGAGEAGAARGRAMAWLTAHAALAAVGCAATAAGLGGGGGAEGLLQAQTRYALLKVSAGYLCDWGWQCTLYFRG